MSKVKSSSSFFFHQLDIVLVQIMFPALTPQSWGMAIKSHSTHFQPRFGMHGSDMGFVYPFVVV